MVSQPTEITLEVIDPTLAADYLKQNHGNRKLRPRVVAALADDMSNDKWAWNGEAIKFGRDGRLQDGQHRLAAIVESNTAQSFLVIRGLAAGARVTMDTGVRRTFADVLHFDGEANYNTLAATVRAVTAWERGTYRSASNITVPQLIATLKKYPWLREGQTAICAAAGKVNLPSRAGGLLWWLFTSIDADDAEAFFNRLVSAANHKEGDPIYAFRKMLLSAESNGKRGDQDPLYLTACGIKAWNKYRAGLPLHQLRYRAGGANPEPYPQPE